MSSYGDLYKGTVPSRDPINDVFPGDYWWLTRVAWGALTIIKNQAGVVVKFMKGFKLGNGVELVNYRNIYGIYLWLAWLNKHRVMAFEFGVLTLTVRVNYGKYWWKFCNFGPYTLIWMFIINGSCFVVQFTWNLVFKQCIFKWKEEENSCVKNEQ